MPELRRHAKMYDGIYPVASDAMGEGKMDPWIAEGAVRILLKSKFTLIRSFLIKLLVACTTLLVTGDQSIAAHLKI